MGKSAPKPTDPRETSAATTGTNLSTAIGNAWMTNMNEYGPDGSREFNNTGMETVTDPYTGQTYQVPRFSVTTTLSPEQQAIKTQQDGASLNLATLGNDLSGTISADTSPSTASRPRRGCSILAGRGWIRCSRSVTRICGPGWQAKGSRQDRQPMTGKWRFSGRTRTTPTISCC